MERIVEGDLAGEIAFAAFRGHALDRGASNVADPLVEAGDVARHEPGLSQSAVLRMIRRIHLYQAAYEVRAAAGLLADVIVSRLVGDGCRPIAAVKEVVLTADLEDIGVPGDDPERIVACRSRDPQRIVGAKPGIALVDSSVRVSLGIDDGVRHLPGDGHLKSLPWDILGRRLRLCDDE